MTTQPLKKHLPSEKVGSDICHSSHRASSAMKIGVGGMTFPVAGMAVALRDRDAARTSVGEPSIEQ